MDFQDFLLLSLLEEASKSEQKPAPHTDIKDLFPSAAVEEKKRKTFSLLCALRLSHYRKKL